MRTKFSSLHLFPYSGKFTSLYPPSCKVSEIHSIHLARIQIQWNSPHPTSEYIFASPYPLWYKFSEIRLPLHSTVTNSRSAKQGLETIYILGKRSRLQNSLFFSRYARIERREAPIIHARGEKPHFMLVPDPFWATFGPTLAPKYGLQTIGCSENFLGGRVQVSNSAITIRCRS